MKHRIGIDARLLTQTGVGTYTRNLLHELSLLPPSDIEYYVYIRPEDEKALPSLPEHFIIHTVNAQWHTVAEQVLFLWKLYQDNLDLIHFCYFSFPLLYNRPFVITIHDLIPYKYPTGKASTKSPFVYVLKHYFYKKILMHGLAHAKKIFVPSKAVKKDIGTFFPKINQIHIIYTYEGLDRHFAQIIPKQLSISIKKPYFLYVGNFYPHKNIPFLIHAFIESNIDARLILCGPSDYFADRIDKLISLHDPRNCIVRVSGISSEEIAHLYSHATALIHPSKDEGFGLPLVEATHFSCPLLLADIPVFREIAPDAHFFDINSHESLVNKLTRIMSGKIKLNASTMNPDFSFKLMAQATYQAYISSL